MYMKGFTPRQRAIVLFILQTQRDRGVSPSIPEICRHLGGLNVKTVAEHLDRLERKGAISRVRGKTRSIEVIDPKIISNPAQVPLVGTIAAGCPIEAFEERETLDVPATLGIGAKPGIFALRVRGDSMIEDGIFDGDVVFVEKREVARNGETVVALLDGGEATLKRYYKEEGRIRLQPANSRLQPIYSDHVHIQGVVQGVLRTYRNN